MAFFVWNVLMFNKLTQTQSLLPTCKQFYLSHPNFPSLFILSWRKITLDSKHVSSKLTQNQGDTKIKLGLNKTSDVRGKCKLAVRSIENKYLASIITINWYVKDCFSRHHTADREHAKYIYSSFLQDKENNAQIRVSREIHLLQMRNK